MDSLFKKFENLKKLKKILTSDLSFPKTSSAEALSTDNLENDLFANFNNKEETPMFGEKTDKIESKLDGKVTTILDKDSAFEGKMTFEGSVLINGKFRGEIFSDGNLMIGEGGYVEGRIEIGTIQIQGEVRGNILAKNKIEILAPAVVQGDIQAPNLVIREGAIFDGNCSMGREERQKVVDISSRTAE